jgi:predicted ATP-dependent serine protease
MSKIVKLRDLEIPQEVLVPMKTNTILDGFISDRGGLLPSTIYIVVGGAGSGKTSWSIDTIDKLQTVNPTKKFLYISGEQDEIDNYELSQKLPGLANINTLYLAGCTNPKQELIDVLSQGWDGVLIDSLEVVSNRIQTTTPLTAKQSSQWVMDLMFKHKKGGNETKTYTAFMVIQQATKSGTFKGDASIEFDTTGMLYVVNDDTEENRYIMFSKNRRGDNRVKLYYRLYQGKMRYIPRIVVAPIINETIVSDNGHRTFRHSFIN